MGSNKAEIIRSSSDTNQKVVEKIVKVSIVSLGGGLILAWWESEYHADNRQLWMVPFGLILLITPLIIWVSLVFSHASAHHQTVTNNINISVPALPSLPAYSSSSLDPEKL
ncbi:hypothetical protein F8388_003754 [Cannabis sativa]|uniref:Uncharacterized protein n=1 Tax=Cannabis sativa TaxID=3483 RepID=A0A7J6F778_CANSA|nr:hypothetical protein F8388_003754 [Cannabis sativa]